jgi:hypothetical protein
MAGKPVIKGRAEFDGVESEQTSILPLKIKIRNRKF